jgi:hypothetical protein
VAAPVQALAQRLVLLERGSHRRRKRFLVLCQPHPELSEFRVAQRLQFCPGHE